MKILKKVFLDEEVRFFTSPEELHYLSKLHIYKTEHPSVEWRINHNLVCQGIVTQVFYPTENGTLEIILPDTIVHSTPQETLITFGEPQEGIAFLVCPRVVGKLDWSEISASLN